jgi:hypothetical protein
MTTTSTLRRWWAVDLCEKSGSFPWIEILGRRTPVNPRTVDAWQAFSTTLRARGYEARSVWCFNCRAITGGSGPSLHSYGIATDVDPRENPYLKAFRFDWTKTRFTKPMIDAVLAIRTTNGKRVFAWGGNWITIKDYMHFQIDCHPSDLARGIDWATVPGGKPEEDDVRYVHRGDESPGVIELQRILVMLGHDLRFGDPPGGGPDADGVDGSYGEKTAAAVAAEQRKAMAAGAGIGDENGDFAGPNTWAWLTKRLATRPG